MTQQITPLAGALRQLAALLALTALALSLLVVSPAPAAASPSALANACPTGFPGGAFRDVGSGDTHARAISCLVAWEVTEGIGDNRYDPGGQVTRAQMATFLANLIRSAGRTVPNPSNPRFNDVGGTHAANIEGLAALDIAQGTSTVSFSPSRTVTRAQMATFIDRTLIYLGGPSDDSAGPPFTDVAAGDTHATAIGRLAATGIVQGTAPDRYDPARPVTRAQMASFLMRGADLLVSTGAVTLPFTPAPGTTTPPPADDDMSRRGFPATCPSLSETLNRASAATYMVMGGVQTQSGGQLVERFDFLGTAWGVRDRLLATNAHVAEIFTESAAEGVQYTSAIAVQSGTGEIVRLLRMVVHPDWSQDPLASPDVALFTTQERLPAVLPLAPAASILDLGDAVQIVGFPGDVEDFITQRPGETVPQATALQGSVSARRDYASSVVTPENLAIYQHQAATTPGTSGSAMIHCGLVAGVNNAGTVRVAYRFDPLTGELGPTRIAAATNNFGVHVRWLHDLLGLWDDQALQGREIPAQAAAVGAPGDGGATPAPGPVTGSQVGRYVAAVQAPERPHEFVFDILSDGSIIGVAQWSFGQLQLRGQARPDGLFQMGDDATGEWFGAYIFEVLPDRTVNGLYGEPNRSDEVWPFSGRRIQ